LLAWRAASPTPAPCHRGLWISGDQILDNREFVQGLEQSGTSLLVLQLFRIHQERLPATCEILACMSAVVVLELHLNCPPGRGSSGHNLQLASALSRLTRLRDLRVHGDLQDFPPSLERLQALTSLQLEYSQAGIQEADLAAIAHLTRLVQLVLEAKTGVHGQRSRAGCMEVVRSLPLLEEVGLVHGGWTNADLLMLVPPPERLKKVELGTDRDEESEGSPLFDAVRHWVGYGVEVLTV
jgi:hypothetical protein